MTDENVVDAPAVDLPDDPGPQPTPEEPTNAVVIIKNIDEDGNLRPLIQTSGNVQITEVQFLLEAAIKVFRKELGFDG